VAWGFDVVVEDESDSIAALSLQGPTSYSVLKDADLDVAEMKPFDWIEVEPDLWISRTGFTGDLGYEIWVPRDHALAIWDRLWAAGADWGLRAIGGQALNMARIEAGYIAAGVDFQPVHAVMRLHRGRTPMELGFDRMVAFDKGHFNGRRALLAQRDAGQRFALVKIDIGGFKPADGALIYHRKRTEVGHVTSGIWSPTAKRNIALAELKAPLGISVTTNLWADVYVHEEGVWRHKMVPVVIETKPFFENTRARVTPPRAF
jgi:aminomethyltransferase